MYTFPNAIVKRNTLKIEFETVSMADKATRQGLRVFNVSIAPHQIDKELYNKVNFCMGCYVIEEHNTRQCLKPIGYKVCSECSSTEHTWITCNTEKKKCLNCGETHRTLAYKC